MTLTPEQREELLAQLIAGDIESDSEIALRAFAEDPTLRVEFEQFDSLGEELSELGATEQAILASVRAEAPRWRPDDRHRHLAIVEFERVAGVRPAAWRRLAPWIAAAAILAVGVFLGWPRDRQRTVDPTQYLGEEGRGTIRADGSGDAFETLSWDGKARFGEWIVVSVYSDDPATGGTRLAQSSELEETSRWSPREDHESGETPIESWPDVVWVVVRIVRDGNRSDVLASGAIRRQR